VKEKKKKFSLMVTDLVSFQLQALTLGMRYPSLAKRMQKFAHDIALVIEGLK